MDAVRSFYSNLDLKNEGIYSTKDVIENFSLYYGKSFPELYLFFKKSCPVSEERILNQLKQGKYPCNLEIIDIRYSYLKKRIDILKKKGIEYLLLLSYLTNLDKKHLPLKLKYENELNSCQFFHYGSILVGKDLKSILNALNETINQLERDLARIETETYYFSVISHKKINQEKNQIYPEEEIVAERRLPLDRTSLILKKSKKAANHY